MTWTAVVPFKGGQDVKSRLSPSLGEAHRKALADAMLARLRDVLAGCDSVGRMIAVSPCALGGWPGEWIHDPGKGLNAAIAVAAENVSDRLLVIHCDLPQIEASDIAALLAKAHSGVVAIAPDRHGNGTNALALPASLPFRTRFGPASCAAHMAEATARGLTPILVRRPGLERDCDTPDDLVFAAGLIT